MIPTNFARTEGRGLPSIPGMRSFRRSWIYCMNVELSSVDNPPAPRRAPVDLEAWRSLTSVALTGLRRTYGMGDDRLPHTMRLRGASSMPERRNPRYALIALLGLAL